jgi:hypothetical protein
VADIIVSTRVVNADALAAALATNAVQVAAYTDRTTRRYGQLLLTAVRGRASGRPGPRAQTGDYRRSINLQVIPSGASISARVGTNSPQGARLEFGFNSGTAPQHGVDVLGRHFESPPYPHFGPAFDQVSAQYQAAMRRGIAAIIAGGTP